MLTPPEGNTKLAKTGSAYGLNLYPGTIDLGADRIVVCRWATPACDPGRGGGCLGTHSGRNITDVAHAGKLLRTLFAVQHPEAFVTLVVAETRRAALKGFHVRLNVTSDLEWHRIAPVLFLSDAPTFGMVYDYTKDWRRSVAGWHLTYSASERHGPEEIRAKLARGQNVTVVFNVVKGERLPTRWHGMDVIDGDATDDRWGDATGVIVGLRLKDADGEGLSTQTVSVRSFVKPAA